MLLSDKVSGQHVLPIFRKEFKVEKNLKEALIFVTGLGQYELHLNGQKVGNCFMTPGWTDYDASNLYNIFDVTSQGTLCVFSRRPNDENN